MSDKPESKLNIAIVGCGEMGRVHSERIQADGRAQISLLIDERRDAAESLKNHLQCGAFVHDNIHELLAVPDLDAAIIATPTRFHFEETLTCLRHGLHVLCEKPLSDDRGHIVQLAKESRSLDRVLMVGYQRRFWATFRRLREEVRSERFGKVRAIASHNAERWQQTIVGTWRNDPRLNVGGFVGDAGSHRIDAVFYVTGLAPTEVSATTEFGGSRVEVSAKVTAQLEGGVPLRMTFNGNANTPSEDLFIHCEKGVLILSKGKLRLTVENRVQNVDLPDEESGPDAVHNPTLGFLDTILDGAENLAPPECALPVFDFTHALLASSEAEEVVRIE